MSARGWITREPIDPGVVLGLVGAPEDGAAVLFLGIVRDNNEGRPVARMRYETYGAMAEKVVQQIAEEAATRAATDRLVLVHRVGELGIGEVSVAIAVSSPHRAEAFDGARYAIETIKERLPVWKQEHYVEGGSRWLDGATPPVEAHHE